MWQLIWGFWVGPLYQASKNYEHLRIGSYFWVFDYSCSQYCCFQPPVEIYFGCCSFNTFHRNKQKHLQGCPTLSSARLTLRHAPCVWEGLDFTFQPRLWPCTLHWKAVGVLDVELDVSDCLCRVYFARQTTFHRRILHVFLGKLYVLVN